MDRVERKMREHEARKRQEKRTQGMILPGGDSESESGSVELTVFSVHAKKAAAFLHAQNCSVQGRRAGLVLLASISNKRTEPPSQLPTALLSI